LSYNRCSLKSTAQYLIFFCKNHFSNIEAGDFYSKLRYIIYFMENS
jgi:hypothetical protein